MDPSYIGWILAGIMILIFVPAFVIDSRRKDREADKEAEYNRWEKDHGVDRVRKKGE